MSGLSESEQRKYWSEAPDPSIRNEKGEPVKPGRKRDIMLLDAPIFRLKAADLDAIAAHITSCRLTYRVPADAAAVARR